MTVDQHPATRRTVWAGALATLTVLGTLGAGAAFAEPRPTSGPFLDAAGRTNGCTGGAYLAGRTFTVSFTCPASADVRRENTRMALHQVQADGSWRTIYRSSMVSAATYGSTPLDGPSSTSAQFACTAAMRGTHTYVARTTVTVSTSADDAHPFYGTYKDRGFITC